MSQTTRVIRDAPIKNNNGKIVIWQCKPVLHNKRGISYNVNHNPTIGDVLNKLQFNNHVRLLILDYKK